MIDHTHDSQLESWVESANVAETDFPIQNLPYCLYRPVGGRPTIGIGIGDQILDARFAVSQGLLDLNSATRGALEDDSMNRVMALPMADRHAIRNAASALLARDCETLRDNLEARGQALISQSEVELLVPARIGDYTDFYASVYHATNVGSMFRPDNPLLPNYKWLPIGYHGRASSIVASGHPIRRPTGQVTPEPGQTPPVKACALLDYEMELGVWVAGGNELGTSVSLADAESRLFGLSLVNDWSARDLQKWEYQPLGPFLAKSFATTISPWIVTMEALAPFRCPAFTRAADDPQPLAHLHHPDNESLGGVNLNLEVYLTTEPMRAAGTPAQRLSRGNARDLFWTPAQMLTHHTSNGCNLMPGDLFASGTVSGPTRDSRGCLLELTWDGDANNVVPGTQRTPIELPDGSQRKFLGDGDEVTMRGFCEQDGYRRIGFGDCAGIIQPA